MFRKLALSTLFLVAGLVLAGCAIERVGPPQDPNEVVNTPPPGVGTPDTATTTTPPTPTVPLSPRANIIMKVGEPGTLCPDLYCPPSRSSSPSTKSPRPSDAPSSSPTSPSTATSSPST